MSIFRRRKADADTAVDAGTETDLSTADATDDSATDDSATEGDAAEVTTDAPVDRSTGPFDATEVDDDDGRLDLGALRIRGSEGMELRLEIDQEQQHVIAATVPVDDAG